MGGNSATPTVAIDDDAVNLALWRACHPHMSDEGLREWRGLYETYDIPAVIADARAHGIGRLGPMPGKPQRRSTARKTEEATA